jgi:hypothetical protein
MSPTIVAEFVDANVAQFADPEMMSAVSVTPLFSVKLPPAVALFAVSFRTVATVVLTLTVMAKLLECSTSALVKLDHTSAAVPLGVVAQTSVASMLPAFLAK